MGERADAMNRYGEPPEYIAQATERDLDVAASDITPTTEDDPEAIRENIAQTRAEMSGTIDAIQEKLNPDRLKEQVSDAVHEQVDAVKERVHDATIGRVQRMAGDFGDSARSSGSGFLGTIKDNPIPAAMAALGIAWLWTKRHNGSADRSYDYRGDRYFSESQRRPYGYGSNYTASSYGSPYPSSREYYGVPGGYQGGGYERSSQDQGGEEQGLRDRAGNMVGQAKDTVGDVASQARDKVTDVAGTAQEKVGDFTDAAQERFGEWGDQAQSGMHQAKTRFDQTLDENPLAVSAAAIALGLAVGMSIPDTPWEDRLMGEARDSVMEKAQGAAQQTMQKVQTVVGQVQDTAKDVAKDAAQQVKQTAQQSAQQQGLTSTGGQQNQQGQGQKDQGQQSQQRQQGQQAQQGQQRGQQGGSQQNASQSGSSGAGGQQRGQNQGSSTGSAGAGQPSQSGQSASSGGTQAGSGSTGKPQQTSGQGGAMTGGSSQSAQESQRQTTP